MNISLSKLSKVLDRLASDHVGERAAAGIIASRIIADAGMNWAQILAGKNAPAQVNGQRAPDGPIFGFRRVSRQQMFALTDLLWHCQGLSERERSGLNWIRADMTTEPYVIDPHAAEWLGQLCRREFAPQ
ncbi:hypothetical protein [Roseococcus sp.]|uniref:hypothetical protein n=1 Tax=Roseococcus sp. TaxID=2109646 RepID=UPI003BABAB16